MIGELSSSEAKNREEWNDERQGRSPLYFEPPAAYAKPKPDVTAKVRLPDGQDGRPLPASSEINSLVSDVSLSFISDSNIPQMKLASAADFNQVEYESDSETIEVDTDSDSQDLIISKPVLVTRSGRQVKVWTRFDV